MKREFDTDRLHDILVEINGRSYSEKRLVAIFESLPINIQNEALAEDFDPVACDRIYTHLKRNGVPNT